jgi:hypothetical protein
LDAVLSPKDRSNLPLAEIDPAKLPRFDPRAGAR